MSSSIGSITCESIEGEKVFLVRMYNSQEEIGVKNSIDTWELYDIEAHAETISYLLAKETP